MQEKNKKLLQKSKAPYFYEALYDTEHPSCQTSALQIYGISSIAWSICLARRKLFGSALSHRVNNSRSIPSLLQMAFNEVPFSIHLIFQTLTMFSLYIPQIYKKISYFCHHESETHTVKEPLGPTEKSPGLV